MFMLNKLKLTSITFLFRLVMIYFVYSEIEAGRFITLCGALLKLLQVIIKFVCDRMSYRVILLGINIY